MSMIAVEQHGQEASKRSKSYRVDTVPWSVRPFYFAFAALLGLLIYLYYFLCRVTSRIPIEGPGNHDLSQHAIFCIWHESWWVRSCGLFSRRNALIIHPAAYIKPVHTALRLMGLTEYCLAHPVRKGN